MNPAFLPVWLLIAPLALVVVDWLLAPKTTSVMPRQPGATYTPYPSIGAR